MFLSKGFIGGKSKIRIYSIRRFTFVLSSSLFAFIFVGIFIPFANEQPKAEAAIDLTDTSSMTITSIKDSASLSINPNSAGVFATTSGDNDIAFSVATTNPSGYKVSVRSDSTTLSHDDSSLLTLSSGITAEQFSAGANTQYNNRWGYKPNYYNSSSNSKYYGISTSATVLDRTSAANSTAKDYTISLGARATNSLPSGTYLNDNLIIEAVANNLPSAILTVKYGKGVTGITINGTTIPDGETAILTTGTVYSIDMTTYSNFVFGSWSANYGTLGSSSTQSTTYTIGSTNAILTGNASFVGPNIQFLSSSECTNDLSFAKDTRDDHVYAVQRLADGNCWMMENLDLGRTSLSTSLNSSNTNIANTISYSTFNSWRRNAAIGTTNAGEVISIGGTDSMAKSPYGTLYNYYAVSGGTVAGDNNGSDAEHDICPAGWRLPTGGLSGEQTTLYNNSAYNSALKARSPASEGGLALTLAGRFGYGEPTLTSSNGSYWSATAEDETDTYVINLGPGTVLSTDMITRYFGLSVRCVRKAADSHTLTVSYGTGVADVKVNNVSVANGGTISLEEGVGYQITMTPASNYEFNEWAISSGTIDSTTAQTTTYTIGSGDATLSASAKGRTFTITLNGNGATTAGSTSTTATYNSASLAPITVPQRKYTISGFSTTNNNASGATVSSTSSLTSNHIFNGWYKESSATNLIASSAITPVLQPNTDYTNSSGKWTSTFDQTLYAGWTAQEKTLPTITKSGYTCGWTETGSGATSITYASGGTLAPERHYTLYGVCTPNPYTISLVNTDATTPGSNSTTVTYGTSSITSIINPSRTYSISGFSTSYNNASGASVSSSSNLNYTYSFNGWFTSTSGGSRIINAGGALLPSTTYTNSSSAWISASNQTLYAQWANSSVTLPTITKSGYVCGWSTSNNTATISYSSGATNFHPVANTVLYGVCTGNTYTITLNGNGATTAGSTSTTATYGSSNLAAITVPQRKYTISGFTTPAGNNAANANVSSTSTLTSTYTFNGWYKESSATNKIASNAAIPALMASTSFTNSSAEWTSTSGTTLYAGWTSQAKALPTITKSGYECGWTTTSTGATSITYSSGATITPSENIVLYGVCKGSTYTVTLNGNGATTAGSTSATATYGSSSLSSITIPQRAYTISGFSTPSGNNASGASVSSSSTLTSTYTFNGWYKESSATNKIASNGSTPALQANTSYTNSSSQWTSTSGQTLYAGWSSQAKTLPTITKSGHTCGWTTTSSGATSITYSSGGSFTPSANTTLYGVCTTSISQLTYLQDFNGLSATGKTMVLNSMSYDTTYNLIDNRDNKTYKIAKLRDGKIWMADNLDLGRTSLSVNLTSSNTNISSTVYASTFNSWKKTSGSGTYTASEYIPVSGTDSTSGTIYGTLYNYCAASAGTICADSSTSDAQYDICPAGWRLPTGGSSGEYMTLYNVSNYNSPTNMRKSIASGGAGFSLPGSFNISEPNNIGTTGRYWSSTYSYEQSMYYLQLTSSNCYPGNNYYRRSGYSIKCIVK